MTIRPCVDADIPAIENVICDAARAYKGVIPDDLWHEPYMPRAILEKEIGAGVRFTAYEEGGEVLGVMGLQRVHDAVLIRHAYVRTQAQRRGIGGSLMRSLIPGAESRLLVGTWAAAYWAIAFYQRHGFLLVADGKDALLDRYWTITPRQRDVSVVLVRRDEPSRPA